MSKKRTKDTKRFPLTLPAELHDLLGRAAFATGKSKHQYCLDAIRTCAERDAARVVVLPPEDDQADGDK